MAQVGQSSKPKSILRLFPRLNRGDRISLVELFEKNAEWNIDFIVMMALATALAALGLLQNSTPVVIGAMLVAPLMSPLIGSGFALVQGNLDLFLGSMKAMSYGVICGFLISFLLGFCTLEYELTLEVIARGNVNFLDLLVAFLSGVAAAYSMGRPELFATIAGVAIAAALVPPLAVVGIACASGVYWLAGASAVLLITNLVAIILGAAFVFRCLGVHGAVADSKMPAWASRIFILLILVAGMLIYPLADRAQKQALLGQTRPHTYPASLKVRQAVQDRVDQEKDVEVLAVARVGVEPEHGINIVLVSKRDPPKNLSEDLDATVDNALGENIKVRVAILKGTVDDYLQEVN
jgi:uncharacterized hydrophobic protein (TIGR00271 family)